MSDWTEWRLGDLVAASAGLIKTGPFGSQLHANEYSTNPQGVPVVMPKNMVNGRIDHASVKRVEAAVANRLRDHRLASGDIVLARRGELGRFAFIDDEDVGALCGTGGIRIHISNRTAVTPRFLRYAVSHPAVAGWFTAHAVGSTLPNLNASTVADLRLLIPDIPTQRRISAILSSFDNSIRASEQRIELLESLACSLYQEWFVRYRFPGHEDTRQVESGLGQIPEGWSLRSLFEIGEVGFGYAFRSKRFSSQGPFPVVRIRDVPRGETNTFTDEEVDSRFRVEDGDILVGMDGEFHIRQWTGGPSWLNQRVARVRPLGELSARHLLLALVRPIKELNGSITGTTVAHLGKRHLEGIRIPLPSGSLLARASSAFRSIAELELELERTIRVLVTTRDLLLPRLVTGRLDVSDLDLDSLLSLDEVA